MMEIINYMLFFFTLIGVIVVIMWVVIPLVDALLYGAGYTIFNILCTNRKKALSKPHRYVITVIKWFIIGFGERLIYGTTGTHTIGNKIWRPYFHYK